MKGYRLHDERIARSGGTDSMRTIKYELVDNAVPSDRRGVHVQLRDRVAAAVFADYRKLYGPLNFSDFLEHRRDPSVLEFWLLTLKLGVFYGSSRDKLPAEFDAYRGRTGDWDAVFASIQPSMREVLDRDAWRNFMIASQRGLEAKSLEQRERVVLGILDREHAKDETAIARIRPVAARFAAEFLEAEDKRAFKAELFGVESPQREPERSFGMSWVINPAWKEIDWQLGDDPTIVVEAAMARLAAVQGNDPRRWQVALGIGNNGGYINSILGTGARQLLAGKADELAAQAARSFDFSQSERQIITKRMHILADYLQMLGGPQVVSSWSDFRSDFNGTLESWYSNRTAKHDLALEQLIALDEALDGLSAVLRERAAQHEAVFALAEELQHVVADAAARRWFTVEDSRSIKLLLGELRSALNEWRQRSGVTDPRLAKGSDIGRVLGMNVQSSALFFGVAQQQRYEKLLHLKQDVQKQLELLADMWCWTLANLDRSAMVTNRAVGALAAASGRAEHEAVRAAYGRLEVALSTSFAYQQGRDRFYISPFDRQKGLRQLAFTTLPAGELLQQADVPELLAQVSADITSPNLLGDVARLSVTLLALALASVADDRQYALDDLSLCTERQRQLLERSGHGEHIDTSTLRVLQSYIHAELSGAAIRLTRRTFLERATVQAVNGGQVRLAYEVAQKSGNTFRRYFVNHTGFHDAHEPEPFGRPLRLAQRSYNFARADFSALQDPVGAYLAVRSSKYQIQFLEWLLGTLPRRKTTIRGGGAFTVAERTVQLDWSRDEPRVSAVEEPRLFVAQPFTLIPPSPAKQLEPETHPCFMGVDVGEYGLAVQIIRCHGTRVESLYRAFLADLQQRVLAADSGAPQPAVRVTMNAPDTHMTRLTESLTGAYRNQLHDLMLRYNAWPVFDWEVSTYGRGARVAKAYNALKRSDVRSRENRPQNRQAWGQLLYDQHRWAKEATAAGTSQTCSRCKRWAGLLITDTDTYPLRPHPIDGLKVAGVGSAHLVCLSKADQLKGDELKRAIYAAGRPPIGGVSLQLGKPATVAQLDEAWKEHRGNMAVFVCPFTDCHHVADADLQAALNIALRGYAKLRSDGKLNKAIDLVGFAAGLDYQPVGL